MTAPEPARAGKLVGIQILRGAAALAIAVHHAQHEAALLAGAQGRSLKPFEAFPWSAGIDVFFVISGFIMVHASAGLFARPGAPRHFLARRLARIVPLYWLATTAYLTIALARPGLLSEPVTDAGYVLASYMFIPLARPDGMVVPFYSLGWTLNYEMFFYALFALALSLPRRRAVLAIISVLAVLVVAGWAASPPTEPLRSWTAPIVLEFAFGAALGLAHAEGFRIPGPARGLLALAALAGFVAAAGSAASLGLGRAILVGGPAAMLVAAVSLGPESRRAESAPARVGSLVGDASYALYLLHPFAIRGVRLLVQGAGLTLLLPLWGFVALSLSGAVALAVAVFLYLERPLTAIVRRALDPPRQTVRDRPTPGRME